MLRKTWLWPLRQGAVVEPEREGRNQAQPGREQAMRILRFSLVSGLMFSTASVGVLTAAPTLAECTSSAGVTVCAQGESRGADTGGGPGSLSGPYYPYPCEYDWTCGDDGGLGSIIAGAGDRPGGGRPDRPNRPNRPGGGGVVQPR